MNVKIKIGGEPSKYIQDLTAFRVTSTGGYYSEEWALQHQPKECAEMLGRLLSALAAKGLLTAPEVCWIVGGGYFSNQASFVTDKEPQP